MGSDARVSDGYVRIPARQLPQLSIEHLASAEDSTIALPDEFPGSSSAAVTGYTEWVGQWGAEQVSIGWDWVQYQGAVQLLSVAEIRTNIRLVADDGVAQSMITTRAHLGEWLRTVPWQLRVMREIGPTGTTTAGR